MGVSQPDRRNRTDVLIALGLFALALLVRIVFLYSSVDTSWPHSVLYEGDAPVWVEWARSLQRDEPFEFDVPLRTPGVAYLLAWFGGDGVEPPFDRIKLIWCALSALSCGVAYLAMRHEFRRGVSFAAAMLGVFAFGSYMTATSLNNETPYTLLVLCIVWGTLAGAGRRSWLLCIAVGVAHGLATLLRAEHTLLMLLLAAYWIACARGMSANRRGDSATKRYAHLWRSTNQAGVMVLVSLLVCLPWSIHAHRNIVRFNTVPQRLPNFDAPGMEWTPDARAEIERLPAFARADNAAYLTFLTQQAGRSRIDAKDVRQFFSERFGYTPEPLSAWVLVSAKGGLDFALANHPAADGGFSLAVLSDESGAPPPRFSFARPDHLRLINHGVAIGWDSIRDAPAAWLGLVGRKLNRFAAGFTLGFTSRNLPIGVGGVRHAVDVTMPEAGNHRVWHVVLLIFAGVGAWVALRHGTGRIWLLVIGYKLIVTVLFYGYARQAVSILPAFYLLVCLGVGLCAQLIARSGRKLSVRKLSVFGTWADAGSRRWVVPAGVAVATAGALLADLTGAWAARSWSAQPLTPAGVIRPAPQWGPQAFETHDGILLEPVSPEEVPR